MMITKMAGELEGVAGNEAFVGCKLVHNWRAFKGSIFSEINDIIYRKNSGS